MKYFLINTAFSLVKIFILSRFFGQLRLKKQAGDCAILANGPSLTNSIKQNIDFLSKLDLLVVNNFAFTNYFFELKPKFYVIAAPEYYKEDINPDLIQINERLFTTLNKVNWDLTLIVPFSARKSRFFNLCKNSNLSFLYINTTPIEGYPWFCNSILKAGLGMPRPHNVLIPSLVSALNLGYKKIHVYGADHSWLKEIFVTDANKVLLSQKHFYDEKTAKAEPMNKGGKGERRLHEILHKWMLSFYGYFVIKDYAESIKAIIINKTPNSYIDAFEKQL